MNSAYAIRETRLQAVALGKVIPGVNDKRTSGMFSGDFSDASSISSNGSGNRFRKLRDTTDMARASLDSLRRGSKESLDDLFKRGLSITRGNEEVDIKRASTGDMMTRSLSQKLGFGTNNLASKVKRASSVRSQHSIIEDQIQRDWLLANQLNAVENNSPQYHTRQNSISSNASSTTTRTNSFMNRFSQFVSSKPVTPQVQHQIKKNNDNTNNSTSNRSPQLPITGQERLVNNRETALGRTAQQAYRGFV